MSQDLIRRLDELNAKIPKVYRFIREADNDEDDTISELAYTGLYTQFVRLANDAKKELQAPAVTQAAPAAA